MQPCTGQHETHEKLVRRFVREARLLNRVRSPHIVRVTDVWEERGTAYYAMDLVETEVDLDDIASDGVTTGGWVLVERCARELLEALQAVHEAGLVHGDVKPGNVMLDSRHGVVLIDFGTARADEEVSDTVTSTSFTRGYAPPELMHPSRVRHAGPWSDLYSWGMLVWGLVHPHPGDEGRPVDAFVRQQGLDPYVDAVGQLAAVGVPGRWCDAVARCVALESDSRPRSVADVLEIIDAGARHGGLVPEETTRSGAGGRADQPGRPLPGSAAPSSELPGPGATRPVADAWRGSAVGRRPSSSTAGDPASGSRTTVTMFARALGDGGAGAWWRLPGAILAVTIVVVASMTLHGTDESESTPSLDGEPVTVDEVTPDASAEPESVRCGPELPCTDGARCVELHCVDVGYDDAASAYREFIRAWNERNDKRYFSTYADVLACYYDRDFHPVGMIRQARARHFLRNDGSRIAVDSIERLEESAGRVVMCEQGRYVGPDGREKPHEKVIVMVLDDRGVWRIETEVGPTAHACDDRWFGD